MAAFRDVIQHQTPSTHSRRTRRRRHEEPAVVAAGKASYRTEVSRDALQVAARDVIEAVAVFRKAASIEDQLQAGAYPHGSVGRGEDDAGVGADGDGDDFVGGVAAGGDVGDGEDGFAFYILGRDGEFAAVVAVGDRVQLDRVQVFGVAAGEGIGFVGYIAADIYGLGTVLADLQIRGGHEGDIGRGADFYRDYCVQVVAAGGDVGNREAGRTLLRLRERGDRSDGEGAGAGCSGDRGQP